MSKVLPHQFLGWIHREGCVSNKAFNTYGEARRLGESDDTIIRISKTDKDGENEMTIYKRSDFIEASDVWAPPTTPDEKIAWLRQEVIKQLGCSEAELDFAMSVPHHQHIMNHKLWRAEQNVINLEAQLAEAYSELGYDPNAEEDYDS